MLPAARTHLGVTVPYRAGRGNCSPNDKGVHHHEVVNRSEASSHPEEAAGKILT